MRDRTTTALLTVLVTCAALVTVAAVKNAFWPQRTLAAAAGSSRTPLELENWTELLDGGHRIGPADAKVVILEFADFECPACRVFARGPLRAIRAKYPNEVAVVYRHWPLSYHRFALPAARAAECAAAQGRFEAMHDLLFAKQDSLGLKTFTRFAADAGVSDTVAFTKCTADPKPILSLAVDTIAAKSVRGYGTPTIVIGGVRLAFVPDSARLDSLVRKELAAVPR